MSASPQRWQQVRGLFEQVCELPQAQWRAALEGLSGDATLVEEALSLLVAQTMELGGVSDQLDTLLTRAAGPELGVGASIGHWRLVQHLASGGMGSVFVAERADGLYEQQVAIKLLRGLPDAVTAGQLAGERRILAGLQHPNIARLYDGGTTPMGQPYLVMEYVQGTTLDRYVAEGGAGLDARLELFLKVCAAVQAAHARLVLHCDLKPGNVLVRADGEPVLVDFGIAHLLDAAQGQARARFCTLPYASPELLGGQPVGIAGDVFSLGVMLLELVADARVARTADQAALPMPPASRLAAAACPWRRRLPGDLDAIIARACAIDPGLRYPSADALARDLLRWRRHQPVQARGGGRLYRAGRFLRRRWRETAAAGVALAIAAGFVWSLKDARDAARTEAQTAEKVSDFLVSAFNAADPRMRGRDAASNQVSARQLLDNSARDIDTDLASTPAMRARLRQVIGQAYMNLGQVPEAEKMLRQAAAELQGPGIDMPYEASRALHDLSLLLSNSGRAKEAIAPARQSLALAERLKNPGMVSGALNILGVALTGVDQNDEALTVLQRALDIRRQQLVGRPADKPWEAHEDENSILNNIGLAYKNRGDYAAAETYYRQAVALARQHYGEQSVAYQSDLAGLSDLLARSGQLRQAADLQERNMALTAKLYGQDSGPMASGYETLAGTYQDLGDLQRADAAYGHALALAPAVYGNDTVNYAILLNNYATLLEDRGETGQAEALYRQSLQIRRDRLGPDDRRTLTTQANLGRLLMRQGHYDQAEPLLDEAYRGLSAKLPPDHRLIQIQRLTRAEFWMRKGDQAKARQLLAEATPAGGWKDGSLLDRRDQLDAEIALRAGDPAAAARIYQALIGRLQGARDATGVVMAKLRLGLAAAQLAMGERQAARAQLVQLAPELRAQLADGAEPLQRLQALEQALQ